MKLNSQQQRPVLDRARLRREGGEWLKAQREARGFSQRRLAETLGSKYYTIVSQLETGCGRIPQTQYRAWAAALNMDPREFVVKILSYYDPITHEIIFPAGGADHEESNVVLK